MRVNVYAEEMTDRIEIIGKEIDGHTFTGLRLYLYLPVTKSDGQNERGPFLHRDGDDDSAAVTFWGKRDLREVLRKALAMLDEHYELKATRESERAALVAEIGDCCKGADPLCAGRCLVEQAARKRAASPPESVSAPTDYVMVPVEPTDEMLMCFGSSWVSGEAYDCYKAMLLLAARSAG